LAALIDQGKVTFEYKHFVVVDPVRSLWAAEAVECAGDQGKFWAYHEVLLQNQKTGTWSKDRLKEFGAQVGVDTKAFGQCLDGRKFKDKVAADIADGTKLALRGTPTFFLNGQQLPLNFETILQAVNEEVKKQ